MAHPLPQLGVGHCRSRPRILVPSTGRARRPRGRRADPADLGPERSVAASMHALSPGTDQRSVTVAVRSGVTPTSTASASAGPSAWTDASNPMALRDNIAACVATTRHRRGRVRRRRGPTSRKVEVLRRSRGFTRSMSGEPERVSTTDVGSLGVPSRPPIVNRRLRKATTTGMRDWPPSDGR